MAFVVVPRHVYAKVHRLIVRARLALLDQAHLGA